MSLAVRLYLHKFLDVIGLHDLRCNLLVAYNYSSLKPLTFAVFIHCLGSSLLPITRNTGTTRNKELQNYREKLKGLQELQNYRTTELLN